MASKDRGDVVRQIGGETYRFRLSFNAMCDLEESTGKTLPKLLEDIEGNPSVSVMRSLIWASLQEHQPGAQLSVAGDICGAIGEGLFDLVAAIMEAADFASGSQEDGADGSQGKAKVQ